MLHVRRVISVKKCEGAEGDFNHRDAQNSELITERSDPASSSEPVHDSHSLCFFTESSFKLLSLSSCGFLEKQSVVPENTLSSSQRSASSCSGQKQIFAVGWLQGGNVKNEEVLCVGGRRRPAALQHVSWPGSLCTLPVFLSSFTFDVKAET